MKEEKEYENYDDVPTIPNFPEIVGLLQTECKLGAQLYR
jgi:hypothetical protein